MFTAIGRRKHAIAKVRIDTTRVGDIQINGVPYAQYLHKNPFGVSSLTRLLEILGLENKPWISVRVCGGGLTSQASACHLAIARALEKHSYRQLLKSKGFLRQDSRKKERRKYGLKKARKSPQFSKR